jgi:hypothetical protein
LAVNRITNAHAVAACSNICSVQRRSNDESSRVDNVSVAGDNPGCLLVSCSTAGSIIYSEEDHTSAFCGLFAARTLGWVTTTKRPSRTPAPGDTWFSRTVEFADRIALQTSDSWLEDHASVSPWDGWSRFRNERRGDRFRRRRLARLNLFRQGDSATSFS